MSRRTSSPGLLIAILVLMACSSPEMARDSGSLPEMRLSIGSDQARVALIDMPRLVDWCKDRELPPPPPVSSAEPAVAQALYDALTAAARERTAESFGQVGRLGESLDAHHSAIEYFRLAADKDALNFLWPYYMGCAYQALGESQQAIAAFERARHLDSTYPTSFARLGQLYLDAEQHEKATESFGLYRDMRPEDGFGSIGLGRLAMLDGDLEAARTHLEHAAEIRAADFQVQFQLGRLYSALGERELAQEHFALAAALPQGAWFLLRDPLMQELEESAGSAASLHREFERLSQTRDWPTLAKLAEEIVQRRPSDATMLLNLVAIYRAQQRFDEAHATLNRASLLRTEDPRFNAARAEVHLAQGDYDDSLAAARSALEMEPALVRGLVVRGRALLMLQRYPEAERDLRQVAEQRPDDASNLFALGEALRLQGKNQQAITTYNRALEIQPGFPDAQRMLEYVKSLG